MDHLHKFYQNKENCDIQIKKARKIMSNVHTTREQYETMQKTLDLMYLHCSEDMNIEVFNIISEMSDRKLEFESRFWSKK